jgi:hypothetical protein
MRTNKFILTYCLLLTSISSFYSQDIKIDSLSFDKSGQIKWMALNEKADTKFDIEEFRWNKWEILGQVDGKGSGNNSYSFLADTTCGIYTIRIKVGTYNSKAVNYPHPVKINVTGGCTKPYVKFGHKTKFEVWDQYGKKIISGCDSIINIKDLKKGNYFLNCGNKLTEFNKYN